MEIILIIHHLHLLKIQLLYQQHNRLIFLLGLSLKVVIREPVLELELMIQNSNSLNSPYF